MHANFDIINNYRVVKKITFIIILTFTLFSCEKEEIVVDVTDYETLEKVVDSEFKKNRMPGLAFATVRNDSIILMEAKGYANVKDNILFTPQTRFEVASISKTIIATAIMQLYEKGKINLGSDINQYLPFKVVNPHFPNDIITVKMLMTHTSSISELNLDYGLIVMYGYQDYPQSISTFLHDYLLKGGQYFTKQSFSNNKPGINFEYSNVGATLLALIVEHVSNTDYSSYCKQNIFEPLGMHRSTFFYNETPRNEIAIPYTDVNNLNPDKPFASYPHYPAGHLMTSIEDLSKFLSAYIMGGNFNGYQLLEPETIEEILSINHKAGNTTDIGLIWYNYTKANTVFWGHNGGMSGISTEMRFDPISKTGIIVFINRSECYPETLYESIFQFSKQ